MLDILIEDHGCCEQLNWRTRVGLHEVGALLEALVGLGLSCFARHPELRLYREEQGHEVVVVPKTGRVQIRVDRGVPLEERVVAARRLLEQIRSAMHQRVAPPTHAAYSLELP